MRNMNIGSMIAASRVMLAAAPKALFKGKKEKRIPKSRKSRKRFF
ncbi:MAG: hypothetical protein PUC98_02760 [Clostridiales bacterium]|nr:hypothetical protein [Clostridiales bacterium]